MKKIIIPTDFSDNAYNAIRYALHLFKDVECSFYLLHTYTPAIYQAEYVLGSPGQIGLADVYEENSITQLEEIKNKLIKEFHNTKHKFLTHSAFNILVDEILEITQNEKIDLVVMGTQGASGAKEIFLGSHAVHVIKKATCPVIAVPSNYIYEKPKEILFPTDFEIKYKKKQLKMLLDIVEKHISRIEVLHVATGYGLKVNQLENKQKLESLLVNPAHIFHELPDQNVIDAINNFRQKKRMHLLAMVQNKHTFLERLFIEPVIKKIGFHIDIPFMVIPYKK